MEILDLKKKYAFTCPCGYEGQASPSLFMSGMQMNMGGATCPDCKLHMGLVINEDNKTMKAYDREKEDIQNGPLPKKCYRKATKEEEAIINQKSQHKHGKKI